MLSDAAKRKVSNYRLDYLQDENAFLPSIASTSGRLHGEFVRFLYFLAHKRAMAFFAAIGQQNPSHKELCQQRGAFFYQHWSRVSVACAQACALRMGVLLLHAGQRHFRAPTCTRCRRTSMQTGVANRLALLPLLR